MGRILGRRMRGRSGWLLAARQKRRRAPIKRHHCAPRGAHGVHRVLRVLPGGQDWLLSQNSGTELSVGPASRSATEKNLPSFASQSSQRFATKMTEEKKNFRRGALEGLRAAGCAGGTVPRREI